MTSDHNVTTGSGCQIPHDRGFDVNTLSHVCILPRPGSRQGIRQGLENRADFVKANRPAARICGSSRPETKCPLNTRREHELERGNMRGRNACKRARRLGTPPRQRISCRDRQTSMVPPMKSSGQRRTQAVRSPSRIGTASRFGMARHNVDMARSRLQLRKDSWFFVQPEKTQRLGPSKISLSSDPMAMAASSTCRLACPIVKTGRDPSDSGGTPTSTPFLRLAALPHSLPMLNGPGPFTARRRASGADLRTWRFSRTFRILWPDRETSGNPLSERG